MEPSEERRRVMDRQLANRQERRRELAEAREAPRDELLEDLAAVRQAVPEQGIASVRVGIGQVTLYGE